MTKIKFVHLHNHSCHSERDALSQIPNMVEWASKNNMGAIALTDHGVMHGLPELFEETTKKDLKAIAGCEVYETDDREDKGKNYHMIMLAKNETGYHNLVRIVSDAFHNGFYRRPRTDWSMIEKYKEGLIVTSACLAARIPQAIMAGELDKAREYAMRYKTIFGEDFYLEIQVNTIAEQHMVNQEIVKMSRELDIPLVVTADAHYVRKDDAEVHQAMLAIGRKKMMDMDDTPEYGGEQTYYIQRPQEIYKALVKQGIDKDVIIEAMNNTGKIADQVNFALVKERDLLPHVDQVDDMEKEMVRLVQKGFKEKIFPMVRKDKKKFDMYMARTQYELNVIRDKGYLDYFYIVADFVRYAKDNRIAVGPGRGSAAGSLISYLLGITEVDPIEHGLFFERFLDVTRQKMPDIDIDIEDTRRHEVYDYLKRMYGSANVAKIGTTGRMTTRKAFRNVLRIYGVPFRESSEIVGMIPDVLGITIQEAYKMNPQLLAMKKKTFTRKEDGKTFSYKKIFEVAEKLEFAVDNHGTHAAGVLITPGPVWDFFPTLTDNGELVTQYDKDEIERLGGVKFDLLGLKTLSIIGLTLRSIEAETGEKIDINKVMRNPNDPEVYKLISRGETEDLFQIASDGMQQLCRRVKPDKFADVVAITALYRPPALASGDTWLYADLKNGKQKVTYRHPDEALYLEETYGVITYQEHVMQLVHHFANWDYSVGDRLRKMSTEQLEELRNGFIYDSLEYMGDNVTKEQLDSIWSAIVRYMGYGFNKAHAVAYTMITYATAWLKVHYPLHWLAGNMTANMGEQEKVAMAFNNIKKQGFEFKAPDVNDSSDFFLAKDGRIVFPMGTIKGVGDLAVQELIKHRPYKTIQDVLDKCNLRVVSKRAMKPLILAGAFDELYPAYNRKEIFEEYLKLKKEPPAKRKQDLDFEWSDRTQSELEMDLIGVYISRHPMERFGFRDFENDYDDGYANALVGGTLTKVKHHTDKSGQRMAFVTVETIWGPVEGVVFASVFSKHKDLLQKGTEVMIKGKKDGNKILANTIEVLPDA